MHSQHFLARSDSCRRPRSTTDRRTDGRVRSIRTTNRGIDSFLNYSQFESRDVDVLVHRSIGAFIHSFVSASESELTRHFSFLLDCGVIHEFVRVLCPAGDPAVDDPAGAIAVDRPFVLDRVAHGDAVAAIER